MSWAGGGIVVIRFSGYERWGPINYDGYGVGNKWKTMGMMISFVSIQDGKMGMVIEIGGYEGYREMGVVS